MDIQEKGGIVSEFSPGTQPYAWNFPRRNRIISALADWILIMEAKERSGSLITADLALEQGKDVYALPGPVNSVLSQGCHRLIRQGAGILITPEELMDETMDEDDRESTSRAWRFVQRYKNQYAPGFMAGWDIGRAAMLTRWGCYLGWITESEAVGILWDLSQKVVEELHSWREFAQSYLFGGLMWKLLCGDSSAGSYLGYIADAATDLLAGKEEQGNGQWRDCPWPAQRKIGFTV